jgi:hypothetical protein
MCCPGICKQRLPRQGDRLPGGMIFKRPRFKQGLYQIFTRLYFRQAVWLFRRLQPIKPRAWPVFRLGVQIAIVAGIIGKGG